MAKDDTLVTLPEGVEVSLHLFIRSDKEDMDMEFTVSGLTLLPNKFLDMVNLSKLKLPPIADDWRVMTREEVKGYKERERADAAAREDRDTLTVSL
jgi:hypothetical protein